MNTILPNEVNGLLRSGLANGNPNDQAQLARLTRLSAAQFYANKFWDRLQTPRTPEQLVEMRQTAVTAWQGAKGQMPPAVGINMQVDTKFNNLKALYAAEYLSAMHRAAVAEATSATPPTFQELRQQFIAQLTEALQPQVPQAEMANHTLHDLTARQTYAKNVAEELLASSRRGTPPRDPGTKRSWLEWKLDQDCPEGEAQRIVADPSLLAIHDALYQAAKRPEPSVVHTDTSHLYSGARHDFRVRLGTIFSTASLKVPGDYLEKLADMVLTNEQAAYPPMDRALNLKALIKTIEADHPQMAAAKLAGHPRLIADHAALCNASYHYRETSNTNALTSAIRSVLAPGSHASAADGEIKQQAEAMVGRVVAMARLGYAEPAIFAETVKQLPPSFKKWLDVSQQLEENPSLKPTPTHPEPKNAQDDNAPFFPATLRCYVEHQTGVRVPTAKEQQEAYKARHEQPQGRPDPTDPKYAGTQWAKSTRIEQQLRALTAFNRGGS